jgi:hypothetical protein
MADKDDMKEKDETEETAEEEASSEAEESEEEETDQEASDTDSEDTDSEGTEEAASDEDEDADADASDEDEDADADASDEDDDADASDEDDDADADASDEDDDAEVETSRAPDDVDEESSEEEDSSEDVAEESSEEEDSSEDVAEESSEEEDSSEDVAEDETSDDEAEDADSDDEEEHEDLVDEDLAAGVDVDAADPEASDEDEGPLRGLAAFYEHPDHLLAAARHARDSKYDDFDAYSPFPIHGMDEAMGLERSWIPWVTFGAGLVGFLTANALQFGMMTFDWPMIIGGKPFAPWPSFVPVMFELTVLVSGVTTAVVMLKAAGCFQTANVIDERITNDRFVLWISADDDEFDEDEVESFLSDLNPLEIKRVHQ